ncbi:hypothetical protein [Bradyrhizobium pachyrhizi]
MITDDPGRGVALDVRIDAGGSESYIKSATVGESAAIGMANLALRLDA